MPETDHLAANASVRQSLDSPNSATDNFLMHNNLLEYMAQNELKKFIFASSWVVYGNVKKDYFAEDQIYLDHCESSYAASKIAGEALTQSYKHTAGIDYLIFRISNMYGKYNFNKDRLVPFTTIKCLNNEDINVSGENKVLDFVYLDDVVDCFIKGIEKFDEVKNNSFNVASGKGTTVKQMVEQIREKTNSQSKITYRPCQKGEESTFIASLEKSSKYLGYIPQYNLSEGVEDFVKWFKENDN